MELRNRYATLEPFTTKDGSTIREYLHTRPAVARGGDARARAGDRAPLPRLSEEIYLIVDGRGRLEIDGEEREVSAGDAC